MLISRLLLAALFAVPCVALAGDSALFDRADGTTVLSRHIQIQQVEQVIRFNYMDNGPGVITDRDIQYRIRTRIQLNLAGDGTTWLRMRAETGRGFDNSWDNAGIGLGTGRWNFNLKSFALGQRLGSRIELQAGGIEFEQGAGSQRTYASGDGHLTGYRFVLKNQTGNWRPHKFTLTTGYLGDFGQPSIFARLHLGRINYAQALVEQGLGEHTTASAEVDLIRGTWFARQAVQSRGLWRPVFDEATVEAVVRASDNASFGWSAMVTRAFGTTRRWNGHALYAHIPKKLYEKGPHPLLLNQGEIGQGKRIACGGSYAVAANTEIGAFVGRRLDDTPGKRWIAQIFLSYQYAPLLRRLLR